MANGVRFLQGSYENSVIIQLRIRVFSESKSVEILLDSELGTNSSNQLSIIRSVAKLDTPDSGFIQSVIEGIVNCFSEIGGFIGAKLVNLIAKKKIL